MVMVDDMHCENCGKDVFDTDIPSFSLVKWNTDTETNALLGVYCSLSCVVLGAAGMWVEERRRSEDSPLVHQIGEPDLAVIETFTEEG